MLETMGRPEMECWDEESSPDLLIRTRSSTGNSAMGDSRGAS